jgi:hypothetical protein
LSGKVRTWQQAFYLHDRFPQLRKMKEAKDRTMTPDQGFWVAIAQFRPEDDPHNHGAAVCRIALYEAPELSAMTQPLTLPPPGLPQRHLFWREEMSDAVVDARLDNYGPADPKTRGVTDDIAWYEYKARLHKILGMNTFSKDLLEFGHNQGFDANSNLYVPSFTPFRWERILAMLSRGGYNLNVLPYYEYAGSTAKTAGVGFDKRAHNLSDKDDYTQIVWSELFNADVSDPDTHTDAAKLLSITLQDVTGGNRPIDAPIKSERLLYGSAGQWGYIDSETIGRRSASPRPGPAPANSKTARQVSINNSGGITPPAASPVAASPAVRSRNPS